MIGEGYYVELLRFASPTNFTHVPRKNFPYLVVLTLLRSLACELSRLCLWNPKLMWLPLIAMRGKCSERNVAINHTICRVTIRDFTYYMYWLYIDHHHVRMCVYVYLTQHIIFYIYVIHISMKGWQLCINFQMEKIHVPCYKLPSDCIDIWRWWVKLINSNQCIILNILTFHLKK